MPGVPHNIHLDRKRAAIVVKAQASFKFLVNPTLGARWFALR